MNKQYATPEGTLAWFNKFENMPSNTIEKLGISCSAVGFGTYRVNEYDENHEEALKEALSNGVNLIDTSSNYGFGQSETVIGNVIKECIGSGEFLRENIILVTKAGYIQGPLIDDIKAKSERGKVVPDIVKLEDHLWHCIHPEFLANQLDQSLKRLGMETIDIFLLHNPEYFLESAKTKHTPHEAALSDYYDRIKKAFDYLETAVKEGKIRSYGISSNTFVTSKTEYTHTNLSRILELAPAELYPSFSTIQCPFNMVENGAVTCPNQSDNKTLLECANLNKLALLANRPLNAIVNNALNRLTDKPVEQPVYEDDLNDTLENLSGLEDRFLNHVLPVLDCDNTYEERVRAEIHISQRFHLARQHVASSQGWQLYVQGQVLLPFEELVETLFSNLTFSQMDNVWFNEYVTTLQETLKLFLAYYNNIDAPFADSMNVMIDHLAPEFSELETLSQKAIALLTHTKGVSSVLIGMRQPQYVEDVINGINQIEDIDVNITKWITIKNAITNSFTQGN
ncbi:MAG: aldo/keto reductase [bacterium]|nr:aldo/keto reductase [bacterium]